MKTEFICFTEEEITSLVDFMANHLTREITDRLARRNVRGCDGTFNGIRCLLQVLDKLEVAEDAFMKAREEKNNE